MVSQATRTRTGNLTWGAQHEVTSCHAVTGAVDFLVTVVVRDMAAYDRFLSRRLLGLPGVRSVNTSFVLRTVKASTALPVE